MAVEDRLDPRLRPLFLKEAAALHEEAAALARRWSGPTGDEAAWRALRRRLHTLKGLAHTAGAHAYADAVHELEVELGAREGSRPDAAAAFEAAWEQLGDRLRRLQAQPDAEPDGAAPPEALGLRLQAAARQAALEQGKRVALSLLGDLDRLPAALAEALAGPLEHLVRNAVVHGIEAPGDRAREGKPALGAVCLALQVEGGRWRIEVSDDGAGVDEAAVRARAGALGWLDAQAPVDLQDFLFRPGFSTAASVTAVAGLGVGLDAVKAAVDGLGGAIELETRAGAGTRFVLRLPGAAGLGACQT